MLFFLIASYGRISKETGDNDVQTAENSVIYLAVNETPVDPRGLNTPEWSRRVGKYTGMFIGGSIEVKVSLKNGHLHLNDEVRLTELKPDFFMTADGEAVVFNVEQLSVG